MGRKQVIYQSTVVFVLLYVLPILYQTLGEVRGLDNTLRWASYRYEISLFCVACAVALFTFSIISLNRRLFQVAGSFVFLCGAIACTLKFGYQVPVSPALLQSIVTSDVRQGLEFINLYSLAWILLGVLAPVVWINCLRFPSVVSFWRMALVALIALVCLIIVMLKHFHGNPSWWQSGLVLVAGGGSAWLFIRGYLPNTHLLMRERILYVIILLLLPPILLTEEAYKGGMRLRIIGSYGPQNVIYSSASYLYYMNFLIRDNPRKSLFDAYPTTISPNFNSDLNVVVVLGESARRDNFSLNGYVRRTNPRLQKVSNLVSFKYHRSSHRLSVRSIPCLLSRLTRDEFVVPLRETTVVELFTRLGFETYWFDIQGTSHGLDRDTFLSAKEAKWQRFRDSFSSRDENDKLAYTHDEALLPFLDEALNASNPRKLIVLLTLGSHASYFNRYPPRFEIWGGEQKSLGRSTLEDVKNSYDATILYTDWFLSKVIERLEDKNALLLYVSDHGESLGEDGLFRHGANASQDVSETQLKTPMIWWASDRFLSEPRNQERFSKLKEKGDRESSHDNVFSSLLGCSGIESTAIDRNLNLCALD